MAHRPAGRRVEDTLVVKSRRLMAVPDAVHAWLLKLYQDNPGADIEDVDYEDDHGLVSVSAVVVPKGRPT